MASMFRFLLPLILCATASAQVNPAWKRPFPPHKIAGNLYYVGTEDLACFLFVTPGGRHPGQHRACRFHPAHP